MTPKETKFRAWDKSEKAYIIEPCGVFDDGQVFIHRGNTIVVIPDAIAIWYTNLVDEKGKEIYEGDIVTIPTEIAKVNIIEWYVNGWYYSNYHAGALQLQALIPPPHVTHK